jgi:hypothetical protein
MHPRPVVGRASEGMAARQRMSRELQRVETKELVESQRFSYDFSELSEANYDDL